METEEFGEVLISVEELNDILLDDEGGYVSKEAEFVDQQIFYFVSNIEIDLPIPELTELINTQVQ
ncbi:hypothetical protein KJK34_14585 [Flavobacterium sp. D11R37]|uniref:hypothetical protein n=1 Tax=Flavobacterium coralii TaxID=2838017 RepID=UPI001CA63135|nr:hypothetical protein [Flavobacterium coralii]MBY8963983.1 hypothetical protein [Flavobacterium coralii]